MFHCGVLCLACKVGLLLPSSILSSHGERMNIYITEMGKYNKSGLFPLSSPPSATETISNEKKEEGNKQGRQAWRRKSSKLSIKDPETKQVHNWCPSIIWNIPLWYIPCKSPFLNKFSYQAKLTEMHSHHLTLELTKFLCS